MPTVAELLNALPEIDAEPPDHSAALLRELTQSAVFPSESTLPIPLGRLRRLSALGTLQARIAAAYLFYWLRSWFHRADEQKRLLAEAHWRTSLRLLDSMSYLRGAVMKVGQMLANFPDIAPKEFVETLERLHFDAPPMHWSLLREMVHNELDEEPESCFTTFERRAFAAASLGQVHRATLRTGEPVVVKVQYPGIARAIRDDVRILNLLLLPARLGRDWESVKDQFADIGTRLEQEADYCLEARMTMEAHRLFASDERIVVPRVYSQYSTSRILTMDRLDGVHLNEYMARNPTQEERNRVAELLIRAWYRLMYVGRLLYLDFHPGNFLFLDDGRIGLLDFGMMLPLDDELWKTFEKTDRALTTGRADDRRAANHDWCEMTGEPVDEERARIIDAYADWCWRARYCGGEFDFGDEQDFREGIVLFGKMVARRYARAKSCTPVIARSHFGWRSILYRLKAKIDIRPLAEDEVRATGWDRSDYA